MFESLTLAPADPILGLTELFQQEPNPRKVNLGVGVYKDADGRTPILGTVKEAERRLLDEATSKSYLPIPGH
ncbi:MAG TPA: aromatic amino acid aminotransferase, partial [Deferrisomatales bacterium]|nr:aromatic amino acid aminotransferase [Deferrisomatales bacterium]